MELVNLYRGDGQFHEKAVKFLEPRLGKLDEVVGHENDVRYVAYAIENTFNMLNLKGR